MKYGAVEIAGEITREILADVYLQKERLPSERKLLERFGCARGTIRQALSLLEDRGLIEIKPGSGSYFIHQHKTRNITGIDQARPLELIDARFALEPHICRLAVLQATGRDLEQAESLLLEMENCNDDM
ncbi:MAG: FadR family transcriptional regulator, partial [Marinovum sp.]|nr:FadR family transcriptional regulator [Marinovum sp.]